MKTPASFTVVLSSLILFLASATTASAAPQTKTREYRPLTAKAVRISVAGSADRTGGGAAMTREGWAHFDHKEWEKAMDRFLSALEADSTDDSAAEGLTMSVYRSGDRKSAAELGEEFSTAMPWIRSMIAETLLTDLKGELDRGELAPSLELVEALPYGEGAYDRVRSLLEVVASEADEAGKTSVAQASK